MGELISPIYIYFKTTNMKKLFLILSIILIGITSQAQTIGKTKTEEYKAEFEKKKDSGMAFKLKKDVEIAAEKEKELKQKLRDVKEEEQNVKKNIESLEDTRKRKLSEIQQKATGARTEAAATDPRRLDVGEGKKPLNAAELNQTNGVSATGENGKTVITSATGEKEIRKGGTISWRNNNPGNMRMSEFSKAQGAIGEAGGFAVFPTKEAGERAREKLLFEAESYKNKTLAQAMQRYAPESENNTQAYIDALVKATGANPNTPLSNLTPDQRQKMLAAMKQHEGWKEGTIEKAATGGIFSGPTSGYPVMLHGKEIVIPMQDIQSALKTNDVEKTELPTATTSTTTNNTNTGPGMSEMINVMASKLDDMLEYMRRSNSTQEELLNYARM